VHDDLRLVSLRDKSIESYAALRIRETYDRGITGGVLASAKIHGKRKDIARHLRGWVLLQRVIVASLALAGLVMTTHGGAVGASTNSKVPVIICPTEFGASRPTNPSNIPKTVSVPLSHILASSVAVYTDKAHLQSVLGPRGWRCSAAYGADGNGGVVIFPKTESITYTGVYLDNKRDLQAIDADWSPACVDCILAQACPFFARAKAMYSALGYPNATSTCREPRGEVHTSSGSSLATFSDPPDVRGLASPSGGRYRALGFVYWAGELKLKSGQQGTNGSAVVSCTVTPALRNICRESFLYFQRHDEDKLKAA
jgi:hypothetical protein